MKMKCLEKIVAFCEGWTNDVGCEARRLLADLQPDTAESEVRESVIEASDVVDRRQAAPHTQRRRASDEHPGKQHHEDAHAGMSHNLILVVRFGS